MTVAVPTLAGFDGREHEYTPYTAVAENYDNTRRPNGMGIILGGLMQHSSKLDDMTLLDVGCGTGSFLEAMQGRMKVQGIEYNDGMLEKAKARGLDVIQGSAIDLPYANESFDAVTLNQVVHHFPNDKDFEFLAQSVAEAFRVLKPGGIFAINTSGPEQQRDGFWWLALFPKSEQAMMSRFPPIPTIVDKMRKATFVVDPDAVLVFPQLTLMGQDYYLARGVDAGFDSKYRDGDSSWGMAKSLGELEEGLAKLRAMKEAGTASAWLEGREDLRARTGQVTMVIGRKPQMFMPQEARGA